MISINCETLEICVYCADCGTYIDHKPIYKERAERLDIDVEKCHKCSKSLEKEHDYEVESLERRNESLQCELTNTQTELQELKADYEDQLEKLNAIVEALKL